MARGWEVTEDILVFENLEAFCYAEIVMVQMELDCQINCVRLSRIDTLWDVASGGCFRWKWSKVGVDFGSPFFVISGF